jgi:MFS family permease
MAGLSSFYTFYLIEKFQLSVRSAQVHLFIFLFASALGTIAGGPIGDRVGRKPVIWASILGVAPFALLLPHADLFWTTLLTVIIGLVLSSAFSAILVYAQELIPGHVGMVSGLFFGFAFGMGGLGAASLGMLADRTSIEFVYQTIAYLPLLGLVAALLPRRPRQARVGSSLRNKHTADRREMIRASVTSRGETANSPNLRLKVIISCNTWDSARRTVVPTGASPMAQVEPRAVPIVDSAYVSFTRRSPADARPRSVLAGRPE